MQTLVIHGRQPALGRAELESLYGADALNPVGEIATLIDIEPAEIDFSRLGGMVKFCKLLTVLDTVNWRDIEQHLLEKVVNHLVHLPEGKLKIGLSSYGLNVSPNQMMKTGLNLKKAAKTAGRAVRYIPNKDTSLNAAQVLYNKLTQKLGWELIFISDGQKTYLAQSIAVQDIDAYAARDQARPYRDARVGMLPPKLAQTIINLAIGRSSQDGDGLDGSLGSSEERMNRTHGTKNERQSVTDTAIRQEHKRVMSSAHKQSYAPITVLDAFCGTGVILQEALLMGYCVYGTDIDQRMVDYSQKNLGWLGENYPKITDIDKTLEVKDACIGRWTHPFDTIASETYLGRALSAQPDGQALQKIIQDCDTIHTKFLNNLATQTKPGFRMCLAIPAWRVANSFVHLPMLDSLEKLGYNRVSFDCVSNQDLIYHRPGQIVARELIVLERK